MIKPLIEIGYNKGELDFSVRGTVQDLTIEELNELRKMIVVTIYVVEDMWRRNRDRLNPPCKVENKQLQIKSK